MYKITIGIKKQVVKNPIFHEEQKSHKTYTYTGHQMNIRCMIKFIDDLIKFNQIYMMNKIIFNYLVPTRKTKK